MSVMLCPCILGTALLMDLLYCVMRVCELKCVWVWLLFCCSMLWKCLVWVEVLCWIDHVWNVRVVPVIPVFLPYVLFILLYLLI